ncbi:MAG TPA: PPC domain-containing protein [Longimicrobiales bacterium]|nr:PPC domain-containing protein [Longimicrobiales bacterium]
MRSRRALAGAYRTHFQRGFMRFRPILTLALAGAAAGCGPSTPAPEPPAPRVEVTAEADGRLLRPGESATGVITEEDPTWGTNGRFHLYRFEAAEGDRLAVEMASEEFDTYLVVGDRSVGIFNPLAQDDDSGGELDARVRFVAPRTGTFWVIAQAYAEYGTGAYTISLARLPEPAPAVAQRIAVGASVAGELEESDAQDEEDESFYDLYTFEAVGGQRYSVVMSSSAFDTYLIVGRGTDELEEITRDDDSGGGTDSRIVFAADRSGTYAIHATSFGGNATGEYSLSVNEMAPPGPLTVTPATVGESITGTLGAGDAMSEEGSWQDFHSFRGSEGQRIAVTLRSADFDSFLELGELDGEDFLSDYSDDDSGGGLDSRIVATLDRTGEYTVRATSLNPDETGGYSLLIEELPAPGPVSVRAIAVGQTLNGALEPSDAVLEDESFYDVYTFSGSRGQRVRITLRSDDFDSYLSFGRWRNGEVDIIDSDDDSGGNLDSQLEVTLPESGTWAIQANSLGASEMGDYTVTLEEL